MRSESDECDDDGDDSSPLPDCPRCGEPVGFVTATGPVTASASPCGCSVPFGLGQRDD
ncbi:hypothetical protein [Natrinema versiforme]|uniref:Small CPxCG-related zinc finger protein n=1 Tax=Natrinema versiforme JCM 10478 TaxID=1227496 RepID=L9Y9K4_9EURY|nr:hypothetical protein [Natrinema versiforme]ELY69573.1 hypothetical protein C489_04731 [Natrinema versiforme JCM 10478]